MSVDHNHEITDQAYYFHPSNRKLPENLKEEAGNMLNTGSKAAKVALLMSSKSNKVIMSKDLHNANATAKASEIEKLKKLVEDRTKKDGKINLKAIIKN
jgi:hypothetical protein